MNNIVQESIDNIPRLRSSFKQAVLAKSDSELLDLAFKVAIAAVSKADTKILDAEARLGRKLYRGLNSVILCEEIIESAETAYTKLLDIANWEDDD